MPSADAIAGIGANLPFNLGGAKIAAAADINPEEAINTFNPLNRNSVWNNPQGAINSLNPFNRNAARNSFWPSADAAAQVGANLPFNLGRARVAGEANVNGQDNLNPFNFGF